MTDMDQELLNEFVVESREQLEQVEPDLMGLDTSGGPLDSEIVNRIFRAVHSVKGAAGFFDLHVVNRLAHAAESVLMPVRDGEIAPDGEMVDLLLAANDRLRALVDDVLHSNDEDVDEMVASLERWLAVQRGEVSADASESEEAAGDEAAVVEAGAEESSDEAPVRVSGAPVPALEERGIPGTLAIDSDTKARLLRHGRHIYRVHISAAEHVIGKGITLPALIDKYAKVGDVLACARIGDEPPERAEYYVYAATVLDANMAHYGFDIAADRVTALSIEDAEAGDPDAGVGAAPSPPVVAPDSSAEPEAEADSTDEPEEESAAAPELEPVVVAAPAPPAAPKAVAPPAAPKAVAPPAAPKAVAPPAAPKAVAPPAAPKAAAAPAPPKAVVPPAKPTPKPVARAAGGADGGGGRSDERTQARSDETVRVKTSVLNALMEMAGEMVLGRNRLLRALEGEVDRIEGLGPILHQVSAITTSMQEGVMRTRLQPLGSAFGKFRRLVRDMSTKLGKDVALETSGEDVELDKTIIEGLGDPLVHLIRNSLDHGVETPEEREAVGKPRRALVRIEAFHEGGMVNIDVKDDGRGIDVDRVKQKAYENGLISEADLDRLSDRETYNLIFLPGFSTAKKVTDVSGRGVGMDVVRTNIEKLGGSVDLNSSAGQGSVVSLKLPLTLAIVSSLILQVEDQRFALPQVGLEEVIRLKPNCGDARIERVRGANVLRHRGKLLPIVRLADVLGIERTFVDPESGARQADRRERLGDRRSGDLAANDGDRRAGADRRRSLANVQRILVLKIGRNRFGMLVDQILDNEEIVVKPLSRFVKGCPSFSGATILGDGTISMILDTMGVMHQARLRFDDLAGEMRQESEAEQRRTLRETVPLVLFTVGTEETFALPLGQVARIEKVKVADLKHVGGREYLNYLGGSVPLLRLDHNLPLTGAAEPTETIEVIIPKHSGHPIGIVATRVLDARDIDVELDRETIAMEGLLGSCLVDGDILLLLDIHGFASLAGEGRSTIRRSLPYGPSGALRALLAEDTPYFSAIVEAVLRRAGAEVVTVTDGREAWDRISAAPSDFDVVLTDLVMPALDGRGLLTRIRSDERTAELRVVALTAGQTSGDLTDGRVVFDGHAARLDADGLVQCIGSLFENRMAVGM